MACITIFKEKPSTFWISRGIIDSLKSTNDLLNQELQKLQAQKSEKKAREAALFAAEESSKYSDAKEIVKSLTGLMNDLAEKLAPEVYDINNLKSVHAQVEALVKNSGNHISQHSSLVTDSSMSYHHTSLAKPLLIKKGISNIHDHQMVDTSDGARDLPLSANDCSLQHGIENDPKPPKISSVRFSNEGGAHLIEQFEPGVYVTLVQLHAGTRVFKRVRFRQFLLSILISFLLAIA